MCGTMTSQIVERRRTPPLIGIPKKPATIKPFWVNWTQCQMLVNKLLTPT